MDLSTALTADIVDLCSHVGLEPDTLTAPLQILQRDLRLAVSSYVGLELTVTDHGRPVSFVAFEPAADIDGIKASLHLPLAAIDLPQAVTGPDRAPICYASSPGAFVDLAADLSYALRLPIPRSPADAVDDATAGLHIELDRHLTPSSLESGIRGASDVSTVNRAVGVLIGEGLPPEEAHHELAARAAAAGITVILYAAQLLRPSAP